ncbi:MAG: hypothetical protein ACHQIM_11965 [Sphingobacteriales bacterium]
MREAYLCLGLNGMLDPAGALKITVNYLQMKHYLTPELIRHIEQKATDPIWKMGVLMGGHKTWYSILALSPNNLIHFYGNRDTGWEHVISRHSFYSNDLYFGEGALGDPSRFHTGGIAIFEWVQIADDVYSRGNIVEGEHPDAALFVRYTGQSNRYAGSNGEMKDFNVILYRGTKIVHSIFPKKHMQKPDTPKTKLRDLKRGLDWISAKKKLMGNELIIRIPYMNSEITERYVIVICIDLETLRSKAHLQVNYQSGVPFFSVNKLLFFDVKNLDKKDVDEGNIELTRFLNSFCRYADFKEIEKEMKIIEARVFGKDIS